MPFHRQHSMAQALAANGQVVAWFIHATQGMNLQIDIPVWWALIVGGARWKDGREVEDTSLAYLV